MDKIKCLACTYKFPRFLDYIGVSLYLLYVYAGWWMIFCALIGGFLQLASYIVNTNENKTEIDITKVNNQIKLLKKDPYIVAVHCTILCLLNLFPIVVSFFSIPFPRKDWDGNIYYMNVEYEGGVFVTLTALFIILVYICGCVGRFDTCKKGITALKEEFEYYNAHGISLQKRNRQIEYEKRAREREIDNEKKNKLKLIYGEDYKVLKYDPTHPECKIIYSNKEKKITINGIEYKYSEIERCSIGVDKSVTIDIPGSETYTTKTNTGSMVKRAVVGGILTGGVGAVIGAATAKKETIKKSEPSRKVVLGDYAVRIYLKNKKSPIEIKKLKQFHDAKIIEDCINSILKSEKIPTKNEEEQETYNEYSEAEALDRLVELKMRESLTEDEQIELDALRKRTIKNI